MSGSIADESLTDYRRQLVARYKLRGYSVTEITNALAEHKYADPESGEGVLFVNPATDKPWCRATVQKDLVFLREQWKQTAARDTDDAYSELLAQLNAAIRDAWDCGKLDLVMRGLKDKRDLIGVGKGVLPNEPNDDGDLLLGMEGMSNDQLSSFIRLAGFIAAGGPSYDSPGSGKPAGDIIEVAPSGGAGAGST